MSVYICTHIDIFKVSNKPQGIISGTEVFVFPSSIDINFFDG